MALSTILGNMQTTGMTMTFITYSIIYKNIHKYGNIFLNTTGGKLEIKQCAIYTLEWDFDKHGITFLKENTPSSITIQSSETKTNQRIPHLPNNLSFKYLWVHTSPNIYVKINNHM